MTISGPFMQAELLFTRVVLVFVAWFQAGSANDFLGVSTRSRHVIGLTTPSALTRSVTYVWHRPPSVWIWHRPPSDGSWHRPPSDGCWHRPPSDGSWHLPPSVWMWHRPPSVWMWHRPPSDWLWHRSPSDNRPVTGCGALVSL